MNLRDLEYLVELHRHGHFGRAAEACHVSQPTLSAQFKKLEKELGLPILDRSVKGVVFTSVGLEVLERAKTMLLLGEDIRELGRNHHDPEGGTLKTGVIPTIGPYLLPRVLQDLKESFPRLRFHFRDATTDQIVAHLKSGDLDLGLLALPLMVEGTEEFPIYEEAFELALPPKHPRAAEKKVGPWLNEEQVFLLEEGHCFGSQALQLCSTYGSFRGHPFRGTSLETLRAMVAQGEGVTAVPKLTAMTWREQGSDLVFLPFENPVPLRSVGFMGRQKALRRDLVEKIVSKLTRSMKGVLPTGRKASKLISVY